jgi:hypothetical protein
MQRESGKEHAICLGDYRDIFACILKVQMSGVPEIPIDVGSTVH